MSILLSGYEKTTQKLCFRVYLAQIPETERRLRTRCEHLTALDLLSAALYRDFGIRHAKIRRSGLKKPVLQHDSLHMNLSHCRGLAAAAVGTVPLGIDAEIPRTVRENLFPRICTPEEVAEITAADDKNFVFTRFWTLKESYAKYTGEGIGLNFSTLGFTLGNPLVFHHPAAENVMFIQQILENQSVISLCVPRGDYCLKTERGQQEC